MNEQQILLLSPVQASSYNQPKYLRSICRCNIFTFRKYPVGNIHYGRQGRVLYFRGKKSERNCRKLSVNDI